MRDAVVLWRMGTLLGVTLAFMACSTDPPAARREPQMTFVLTLFDGTAYGSTALRGKTVVVNFWASWCQPCLEEAPALQDVWQAYRHRGVEFVGVVLKGDDTRAAQTFLRQAGIAYPNGQDDDGSLAAAFQIVGLPNTFILTKTGHLVQRFIGPITAVHLRQRLEQALAR